MGTPSQFVGQTVSHYHILRKIGGGGMGIVYEAEDIKLGATSHSSFFPMSLLMTRRLLAASNAKLKLRPR